MKKLAAAMLIAMTVTAVGPTVASVTAREPSYLILRAPAQRPKGHAYYPGRGFEVRTHAYAYGWFGVKPRRHLRRSTGYWENYIQWTKQ